MKESQNMEKKEKNIETKEEKQKGRFHLEHWHVITAFMVVYDFIAIVASYFLALWVRFDCHFQKIPMRYYVPYIETIGIYAAISVVALSIWRLYKSIWRFVSYVELTRTVLVITLTTIAYTLVMYAFVTRMPISYYLFGTVIEFLLIIGMRFSYRFILLLRGRDTRKEAYRKRVMLVGGGSAGQMIIRDIKHSIETSETIQCIIDDNSNKWGRYIDGIPVVGGREDILAACDKYGIEKIYVAIPSASASDKREILNICNESSCELKNLPGMYQLYSGQVSVSNMKDVAVEDLLGREPVKTNMEEIFTYIKGKVVLVTGGGGSIGSELSRQIAGHEPKKLILFDVYENSTYDIQLELRHKYPNLDLEVLIGSVRDSRRIFQIFDDYRPDIVYHAAAHKHVPLMEDSPCEAIKNNAIGTYKTAYAAMTHGCQRFVLISTDKAVNPTNIMGASKRLCEMICQAFDKKIKEGKAYEIPQIFTHTKKVVSSDKIKGALATTKTEFVAVRFGNVLGSNGSVIPVFKKQIEQGGPVTVTHPDIIRYFMTIPEAVSLVLQAGVYAHGGEIFVLDMGEPVKIDTLARNLIRLSGLKVGTDIQIEYSGLRPGEKLYEEKLMAEEGLKKTENELIHIGCPVSFEVEPFLVELVELMEAAYRNEDDIRERVKKVVGTYKVE